jgi:hypothetical protein
MDALLADVRYTLRSFRREPAFFSFVTGILAFGIAASVSMFSLVDGVLLRPLPYSDPGRLVMLTTYAPKPPFDSNGSLSFNDFRRFKAKSHSFSDLAVTFRTGWSRGHGGRQRTDCDAGRIRFAESVRHVRTLAAGGPYVHRRGEPACRAGGSDQ